MKETANSSAAHSCCLLAPHLHHADQALACPVFEIAVPSRVCSPRNDAKRTRKSLKEPPTLRSVEDTLWPTGPGVAFVTRLLVPIPGAYDGVAGQVT